MTERPVAHDDSAARTARLLIFRAGGIRYALPHDAIQEIVRTPAMARVPLSPRALMGLGNLRGAVLPVADLATLLGVADEAREVDGRVLVLAGASPVGLHVGQVDELAETGEGDIQPADAAFTAKEGEAIAGLFRREGDATPARILDLSTLLSRTFAGQGHGGAERGGQAHRRVEAQARDTGKTDTLVTFEVAGQAYALPVEAVLEILPAGDRAKAAAAGETAAPGLVAFRGALLPIFSLRSLLGFEAGAQDSGWIVVARVAGSQVGLSVDRVDAIIRVSSETHEPVPGVIAERATGEARVQSVVKLEGGDMLVSVLSPDHLFREDIMNRIRRETREASAVPAAAQAEAERVFLVFRLGEQEFGAAISAVEEVSRLPEQITPLPQAPEFLKGVVNLRGAVLPIIDQRTRFGFSASETDERERLVVMRLGDRIAGFIVDGVSEVLRTAESSIAPPPQLAMGGQALEGVINMDDGNRIILLLDPAQLLSSRERGLLDTLGRVEKAQPDLDQASDRR